MITWLALCFQPRAQQPSFHPAAMADALTLREQGRLVLLAICSASSRSRKAVQPSGAVMSYSTLDFVTLLFLHTAKNIFLLNESSIYVTCGPSRCRPSVNPSSAAPPAHERSPDWGVNSPSCSSYVIQVMTNAAELSQVNVSGHWDCALIFTACFFLVYYVKSLGLKCVCVCTCALPTQILLGFTCICLIRLHALQFLSNKLVSSSPARYRPVFALEPLRFLNLKSHQMTFVPFTWLWAVTKPRCRRLMTSWLCLQ